MLRLLHPLLLLYLTLLLLPRLLPLLLPVLPLPLLQPLILLHPLLFPLQAGRAAAASLRQALLGARGAGSSTAGPSGAGPSGEAARGAAAAALTDRNRLGVLRKSLEWMPSKCAPGIRPRVA